MGCQGDNYFSGSARNLGVVLKKVDKGIKVLLVQSAFVSWHVFFAFSNLENVVWLSIARESSQVLGVPEEPEVCSQRVFLPDDARVDAESSETIAIDKSFLGILVHAVLFQKVDHSWVVNIRFLLGHFGDKVDAKVRSHEALSVRFLADFGVFLEHF